MKEKPAHQSTKEGQERWWLGAARGSLFPPKGNSKSAPSIPPHPTPLLTMVAWSCLKGLSYKSLVKPTEIHLRLGDGNSGVP